MIFVLLLFYNLLNQIFDECVLGLLDGFHLKILSLFGFLVDRFQIPVCDRDVLVFIEVDRYSLLISQLHSPPFKLIAVEFL